MPAYNEEKTIAKVIEKTKDYVDKLIVVDDCSNDRTRFIAQNLGTIVISHKNNIGLGGAIRTGIKKALEISKNDSDIIITIDADGQHNPKEIPKFLHKINEGYDFVLGNRNLSKYPFIKKFGNSFLNFTTNFLSGTNLKDTEGGFRAFTRKALKKIKLRSERYEIAVEIVYEIGRNNIRSANVDISSPVYVKGVGIWDGVGNFLYLLRLKL